MKYKRQIIKGLFAGWSAVKIWNPATDTAKDDGDFLAGVSIEWECIFCVIHVAGDFKAHRIALADPQSLSKFRDLFSQFGAMTVILDRCSASIYHDKA